MSQQTQNYEPHITKWILPVSVKLDGKITHDTHSFISEGHLHLDDTSTACKCARYLQTLGLHGWKPNLNRSEINSFIFRDTSISYII